MHLAGDQPGRESERGGRPGITDPPESSCASATIAVCGSGRCSPGMAGSTSPSRKSARPLRAPGAVLGDLADLRYNARWIGLPASLVGPQHPRFRILILARRVVPNPARLRLRQGWGDAGSGQCAPRHDRTQPSGDRPRDPARTPLPGGDVRADRGVLRRWGRFAQAIARWERITGRPAPAPRHPERRCRTKAGASLRGMAHGPGRGVDHRWQPRAYPRSAAHRARQWRSAETGSRSAANSTGPVGAVTHRARRGDR